MYSRPHTIEITVNLKWYAPVAGALFAFVPAGWSFHSDRFSPSHRLAGIGVDRREISAATLEERTSRMIESETFAIMREPEALAGAERITSPKLQKLFKSASESSGFPADVLAAMAYLESWGNPRAESPAGPKGIMQFSEATARGAGLRVLYKTRYRVVVSHQQVRNKRGKLVTKKVKTKIPYTVLSRDDRFSPEKAVPAAARYLAHLTEKFGAQDWAIFAYHCGEGCVAQLQPLAQQALKDLGQPVTVAAAFFAASPAWHRELYDALHFHMQRDYSPTNWFRIMRAMQLLKVYSSDPEEFRTLYADYRLQSNPLHRADHRLVVWLKNQDLYRSCDDLRRAQGKDLVAAFHDPDFFGFSLLPSSAITGDASNRELYEQATPSTVGTLVYIAYETRRLFEAANPNGEKFIPLAVTELVSTIDQNQRREPGYDVPIHCTGQVFDLSTADMPRRERECLDFILDEMGWDGYLSFIAESGDTLHVGSSPSSRDFFAQVYQDALSETQNLAGTK